MSATMDTFQTVPSPTGQGPRFRPFASSVHRVTKGRYITSNDPRGYIPVYEYPLNNQWIMMDIDDGYVLWTGIWKALGNSKADIVKMVDSQPELAHVIRRVRGGYLKIQGTWMPFEVALRLARRVAWNIRDDLIPLFGPTFPSTCLSPDQPGYGQVVASASGRRRARRNPQSALVPITPAHNPSNWQSSAANGVHQVFLQQLAPFSPAPAFSNRPSTQYSTSPIYPVDLQTQGRYSPSSQHSPMERLNQSSRDRHRFTPYPAGSSAMPPPRRISTSSRGSLSLDIHSLSIHDGNRATPSPARPVDPIQLPAIQAPANGDAHSIYALPPISALEDLRGLDTQDSAAVLRRLQQTDDDTYSEPEHAGEGYQQRSRRSFSAPAPKIPPHLGPGLLPLQRRSVGNIPDLPDGRIGYPKLRVSVPSDASHDGTSTCDPSPVSPATPRSAVLGKDHQRALVPLAVLKEQSRMAAPYSFPVAFSHNDWLSDRTDSDSRTSACRYSCVDPSSGGVPVPLTSW
ncbi:hypothetical protein B0H17DRAFT_1206193 [Mycena rosella]|uniref:HTH APSES-type domain-containing protein n=1 Tax=Mycena rosella TaxID=1033263 RepID=A0AAD7D5K6_MYCRO|nr:hypothetical protein B0H17DRAFT_1206193 [Mycena rosella]